MGYRISAIAATIGLVVLPAASFSDERGEFEYFNSCAQCHGADGEGNGPIARYLVDPAPPLTSLSKDNGGIFPVRQVEDVLEGAIDIGVHGRDMPIWGARYREALMEGVECSITAAECDTLVRVRMMSLIDYLSSIQVE